MADRTLVTTFDANIQAFEQKIDRMQRKLNELSATFQKAEQATQSMDKTGEAVQKQGQQVDETNKKLDQHEKNLKKQNKQQKQNNQTINRGTKETENWLSSYSESIQIAVRSTALWGVATTAIYGTKRAMEEMHQVMMDVNSEMVALRRVMDELSTDFDEIQKQATTLGVDLAKNVDEVVKAMVQWGRQGKEQVEVIELTEAALLAANVAQMDAKQAVDLLTAAILQFNKDAAEGVEIVDKLNETANNYATTATDLAMSIRESGAAANNAGIAMDELIGMTTALQAATAKSGNRIGRALRTIFSRILGDMRNTGEAVGRVEVMLNSVGIALRQSEDDYRSMTDVITDLASKWDELSEVQQANIARAMGGRRRYSDVISLIENWDMALDATETSFNSLGSAIEENEKYMDSMEAHWKQAQAQFESLSLAVGELGVEAISKRLAGSLRGVLQDVEETVVGFQHFEEETGLVQDAVMTLSLAITANLIPAVGKLASALMSLAASHPIIATLTALSGIVVGIANKVGEWRKQEEKLEKERKQLNKTLEEGNRLSLEEVNDVDELIDKYSELTTQYIQASDALENLNVAIIEQGDFSTEEWEAIEGFTSLFEWSSLGNYESEQDKRSEEIRKAIEEQEQAIGELRDSFPELNEEYSNNEEFVSAVIDKIYDYRDALESTVSWIGKYTLEQYKTTKQGVRENQMLQEKIDRYQKLASQSELNVEQQAEMQKLIRELEAEWPELAAADDFDIALEDLGTEKMEEFGREGEKVQDTLKQLKEDLGIVEDAEASLKEEQQELAREISNAEKNLESMRKGTDEYKLQDIELQKLYKDYMDISDQIEETIETHGDLKKAIEDLEGTTDDFDPDQFLANWAEVQKIFGDLKDDVQDVGVSIEDLYSEFYAAQELSKFEWDLFDISPIEGMENDLENVEDIQDKGLSLAEELYEIREKLDPNKGLTQEIAESIADISQLEEAEEMDLPTSPEEVFEEWDVDALDKEIDKLLDDLRARLKKFINDEKNYDMAIELGEIIELQGDDLKNLDLDELEQIESQITNAIEEYGMGSNLAQDILFSHFGPEAPEFYFDLVEDFEAANGEMDKLIDNTGYWGDLLSEIRFREQEEQLGEIEETFTQFSEREFFEEPILTDDAEKNVKILKEEVEGLFDSFVDQDISKMIEGEDVDELKDYVKELEDMPAVLEYLDKQYPDVDLSNIIDEEALSEKTNIAKEELKDLRLEIERTEAQEIIDEAAADDMDDYEQEIVDLKDQAQDLTELFDSELTMQQQKQILDLLSNIREEIKETEEEAERAELFEEIVDEQNLEEITDEFEKIDMNEILGIKEAEKALSNAKGLLQEYNVALSDLRRQGFNENEIEEQLSEMGLDLNEEEMEKLIQDLEGYIKDTKWAWADAVSEGVSTAFDDIDDMSKIGEVFSQTSREILSNILDFEEGEQSLNNLFKDVSKGFDEEFGTNIGSEIEQGLSSAVDAYAQGESIGKSLATGIGAAIGTYFGSPQAGTAAGSVLGSIGEALVGGSTGVEAKEEAEEITDNLESAEKQLKELGLTADATYPSVEDTASSLESLFGKEEWDVEDLEEAEKSLEEMEKTLSRVENFVSTTMSGLGDTLAESLNYWDFRQSFEQTIGQALQDSIIDQLLYTYEIEDAIEQVAAMAEGVIDDSGDIDQVALEQLETEIEEVLSQSDELRQVWDEISDEIDILDDPEVDASQTFQAGQTRSITYHNSISVQSQIFMGDESAAREAAEIMLPYLQDAMDRNANG